jgi:hypothetical protein
MSSFGSRKAAAPAAETPLLQLVLDSVSCKHLRNRDLAKKGGRTRAEKADGGASDPFIWLRLVQPAGALRKVKERELARAETPHLSNEANWQLQ